MRLHITHASGLVKLTPEQAHQDYLAATTDGPDVVPLTEFAAKFRHVGRMVPGYRLVWAPKVDEAILIRDEHRLIRAGSRRVFDSPTGRNVTIAWARFKAGHEDVTVIDCHWLAHMEGEVGKRRISWRVVGNRDATKVIARMARRMGRGRRLCFVTGDGNLNANRAAIRRDRRFLFWQAKNSGLVLCWDEKNAPTRGSHGNRLIDVIFRRRADGRVELHRAWVHPKGNSDHRAVSAVYTTKEK